MPRISSRTFLLRDYCICCFLSISFLTIWTVSPVTPRVIIVERSETPRIAGHLPSSKAKEVIRLTPAGRKKNAKFSSKKSLILSMVFNLIIPAYNPKKRIIIPSTLPGIGIPEIF